MIWLSRMNGRSWAVERETDHEPLLQRFQRRSVFTLTQGSPRRRGQPWAEISNAFGVAHLETDPNIPSPSGTQICSHTRLAS